MRGLCVRAVVRGPCVRAVVRVRVHTRACLSIVTQVRFDSQNLDQEPDDVTEAVPRRRCRAVERVSGWRGSIDNLRARTKPDI